MSPADYQQAPPDPDSLEDALIELIDAQPTIRWALAKLPQTAKGNP